MQEYTSKEALIEEIQKTAAQFIGEFDHVADEDSDLRLEGVDRTPREMIAYQLGWMSLIRGWDSAELAGKEVITPAPGYNLIRWVRFMRAFIPPHPLKHFGVKFANRRNYVQNFDVTALLV